MAFIYQKWRSSSHLILVGLHTSVRKSSKGESYTALVVTLDSNYQNFYAPEALGEYKALSKFTTIAAIYLLDYTLPLVAKLSKSLQTNSLICPRSLLLSM